MVKQKYLVEKIITWILSFDIFIISNKHFLVQNFFIEQNLPAQGLKVIMRFSLMYL